MAASRRAVHSPEPSAYYFIVRESDQDGFRTDVLLTDAAYFDSTGAQSDWHVEDILAGSLPLGLSEEAEGMMSSEDRADHVRVAMLRAGFRESRNFYRHFDMLHPDQPSMLNPYGGPAFDNLTIPAAVPEEDDGYDVEPVLRRGPPEEAPPGRPIWERLGEEDEEDRIAETPPTTIEIGLIRKDPRKVTLFCDCCGQQAIYSFKASHRVLGICSISACMKKTIVKMESWAKVAQSKSWGLIETDVLNPPKPPPPPIKEEIIAFQMKQRLDTTGLLDKRTEAELRRVGRPAMIPVWRAKLQEETTQENSWDDPEPGVINTT